MNNILKTIGVAAGVALVVALVVVGLSPNKTTTIVKPDSEDRNLGALTGPDIPYPYLRYGAGYGVRLYPTGIPFKSATTTVCAIQSPAATSTLESAGLKFDVSSTTASEVTVAKATTAFATTTFLFGENIGANAESAFHATTTTDDFVFGPSEWMVVGMKGGTGTFSPSGACHATFEEYISL